MLHIHCKLFTACTGKLNGNAGLKNYVFVNWKGNDKIIISYNDFEHAQCKYSSVMCDSEETEIKI